MSVDSRGILYPARLPSFRRVPPPASLEELVRWFWIPEWDIAPGRSSRQHIVAYPACNLVVEPGQVVISGPTTRRWHRDLTGRGWAVGALLRPAAVPSLAGSPAELRDSQRVLDLPDLRGAVVKAMAIADRDARHAEAVAAFSAWLAERVGPVTDEGRLANAMAELMDADAEVRTLQDAASRLHVSARTLQRLAVRYVGLTPAEMIRRRRLQEAAQRVRLEPDAPLAQIATELGYTDHAHLTREFRDRLGFTPTDYRRGV